MAKTSEAVQFAGRFQAVVGEISRRLEKKGANLVEVIGRLAQPQNEGALEKIAEILMNLLQIFFLTVVGKTTEEVVVLGAYNYVNPNIASQNFPLRPQFMGPREIVLLEFDHDVISEEAIAEAARQGLERPVYEDALRFGAEHPEVQRERPVAFLHEPWRDPYGDLVVLCLWSDAGDRRFGLGWFDDGWLRVFRFAFVRKSS